MKKTIRAESPEPLCSEREWCEMGKYPPSEHEDFHSSPIVDLADCDRDEIGKEKGWWGWLVGRRDEEAARVDLVLEGIVDGRAMMTQLSVVDVSFVLAATETPEARDALWALLDRTEG